MCPLGGPPAVSGGRPCRLRAAERQRERGDGGAHGVGASSHPAPQRAASHHLPVADRRRRRGGISLARTKGGRG
eukprot:9488523-Pyramimonas_sp.AAC.1